MNCQNIFIIIFLVIFIITTVLFLTLYLLELSKSKTNSKNLKSQIELNKNLNKKITNYNIQQSTISKQYEEKIIVENKEENESNMFIFGIADEFKILCPHNKKIKINSMFTKIVDDVSNSSTISDITKFVSAFPMFHNTNNLSLNTKLISDNLKLSIPYALPHEEIVKTRVIYGTYSCVINV